MCCVKLAVLLGYWQIILSSAAWADHSKKPVEARAESNPCRAPLFKGLGHHARNISTDEPLAQQYFNQGLTLAYAFNHAEAERSFREAARLDPDCAMAWWGVALVLGPNINMQMNAEAVPAAYAAIQKATNRAAPATEVERALIAALAKRYAAEPVEDRSELNRAYAAAMRDVVRQYPDDLDAAALLAEALMDLHP